MKQKVVVGLSVITLIISPSASAFNLGKFLKDAADGNNQGASPQAPAGNASAATNSNAGIGSSLTENYCRQLYSVAGISKKQPVDQSLVVDEFNLAAPADFFDAYVETANVPTVAFPSPRFYQGEFETERVNVIYDLLLSYPSPQYLAALIAESRKDSNTPQYDHQAKVDALAALTILHHYMKDRSRNPERWKQLATRLQAEDHYTAKVITARLLLSGELGQKDPDRAISLANEANGQRQKYSSDGGYRTMSPRNYAVTSNRTLYDAVSANPRLPQARYFIQFAQQYEATLKNPIVAPELEARLGPGLRSIETSANSAARKARDMLSGAQQVSLIKAEKSSLDSAMRNRVSDTSIDANIDDKTMLSLTRQLQKVTTFDEKQKVQFASALADAHASGDKAIAMMPTMLSTMMNLVMQRGMASMPAMIPYSKKLQYHSDSACSVISRWDQAAHVTKSVEDPARNSLASLVAESDK